MISEVLSLITFIAGIGAFLLRLGFFRRLFPPLLCQKMLDELSSLKVSTPSLKSTSESNSFSAT